LQQADFLQSLTDLFSIHFHERFPVLANTFYRLTYNLSVAERANEIKSLLDAFTTWTSDQRVRLLRDLARFVQVRQREFDGDAKCWMVTCLTSGSPL
jgi:hypothetical protein